MQFTLTAAALFAAASASGLAHLERRTEYEFNSSCKADEPLAKVVNRCPYPVYIWSIEKQLGCPSGAGMKLETGELYNENLQKTGNGGISIKISKYDTCGDKDHTQLEYFLQYGGDSPGDYLDVSFVDCKGMDCPGRKDGYYFKAGNDGNPAHKQAVNNEHCPIFNVGDATAAAKVAYIEAEDRQTKWCPNEASMELHLCGEEAPGDSPAPAPVSSSYDTPAAPSSSVEQAAPSKAAPSSKKQGGHHEEKPTSQAAAPTSAAYAEVQAAAVTPAPEAAAPPNVKTAVVYETVYVDAKKRHAHGRRHQHYHA